MIPFDVILRWSKAEGKRSESRINLLRAFHKAGLLGRPAIGLCTFLVAVDQGKNLPFYLVLFALYFLITPWFTFIALRREHFPVRLQEASVVPDLILCAHFIVLSGFDPLFTLAVTSCCLGNAVIIRGVRGGIGCCLGLGILITVFYSFMGMPATPLSPDGIYVWPTVFISAAYISLMGYEAYVVSSAHARGRRQLAALNTQIKEQVLVRYLPRDLIADIFDGTLSMDTKPHMRQITVLFSDLSGFTAMSEKHGAEVVSEFLNDYLSVMNDTIFEHQGTIDKFIGDAIMVIFGAPHDMSEEEQAENACKCAAAMQSMMWVINRKWQAKGIDKVSMRIGIHQGKAVVGNFGSKQRVDYTAIGHHVNLASRIENACEPGNIYISEEVRELLSDELPTNLAGEFQLKGIEGKTSLYKLV